MSKAFGYGLLKTQVNTIQSLLLTQSSGSGGQQTLAQTLANGHDAAGIPITGLTSLEGASLDLKYTELLFNDDAGVATQVLTSQGAGLPAIWSAGGSGTQGLASVLAENSDAAGLTMSNLTSVGLTNGVISSTLLPNGLLIGSAASALHEIADVLVLATTNPLDIEARCVQLGGDAGTAGQYFTSQGPNAPAKWSAAGGSGGLEAVLTASNDAAQLSAVNFSMLSSKTVDGVYNAEISGSDGIKYYSDAAQITIFATNQTVLDMRADTNQCYLNVDPTQMILSTSGTPLNLVNKGIQLDGADGLQGYVITSNGAGEAASWQAPPAAGLSAVLAVDGAGGGGSISQVSSVAVEGGSSTTSITPSYVETVRIGGGTTLLAATDTNAHLSLTDPLGNVATLTMETDFTINASGTMNFVADSFNFSGSAVAVGTLTGTGYAVPFNFGGQTFYLQLFTTP